MTETIDDKELLEYLKTIYIPNLMGKPGSRFNFDDVARESEGYWRLVYPVTFCIFLSRKLDLLQVSGNRIKEEFKKIKNYEYWDFRKNNEYDKIFTEYEYWRLNNK